MPRKRATLGRRRPKEWILRLYIAGHIARAAAALRDLEMICEEHLSGTYEIEVIDLLKHPQLARVDHVVAVPTVVGRLLAAIKRMRADLWNAHRVLVGL